MSKRSLLKKKEEIRVETGPITQMGKQLIGKV
jgi:hypothetical protein